MRLRVPATALATTLVAVVAGGALLGGCSSAVKGTAHAEGSPSTPSPTDAGTADPTATVTGLNLPPIGLSLQQVLVDPDPKTDGPAAGTVTIARLTNKKMLALADIHCLEDNSFLVGFAKDTAASTPAMTVWAFQLSSPEGAANCADQMTRTDASVASSVTNLATRYGVENVTVYQAVVRDGANTLVLFRALYAVGSRLFRITVSQQNVTGSAIEGRFRDLLTRQLALAPPG